MTFLDIITTIGVAAIIGGLIYIGRKLQVLDDLQTTIEKVKVNVKVISDYLTIASKDFNHKELQSYSPLTLTKEGQKLIQTLGFDKVFEKNSKDFCEYIDSEQPKLKYDVEKAAINAVSALSDQDYMAFLKVFFYNNPDRSLNNVAPTLGIYIRDKYLKKHPEITE